MAAGDANRRSIRRVLAAVDDSPRAADVIAAATELARNAHATLRLFHAVAVPPELPPAAATADGDPLPMYLHKAATERLRSFAATVVDVPCDVRVEESHRAWQAILEASEAYEADLVVIGSHRYRVLDRIIGATSARVVQFSPRDVLVVHRREGYIESRA